MNESPEPAHNWVPHISILNDLMSMGCGTHAEAFIVLGKITQATSKAYGVDLPWFLGALSCESLVEFAQRIDLVSTSELENFFCGPEGVRHIQTLLFVHGCRDVFDYHPDATPEPSMSQGIIDDPAMVTKATLPDGSIITEVKTFSKL